MASARAPAALPQTTTVPNPNKGIVEVIRELAIDVIDKKVVKIIPEVAFLSPLLFIGGAALFSLMTLNASVGVLAGSSLAAMIVYTFINSAAGYFTSPSTGTSPAQTSAECKSSFTTMTPARFSSLIGGGLRSSFPSQSLYFIVFAISYIVMSMTFYSKEITELGERYSNKYYLSIIGGSIFIFLYALYLLVFKCDSILSLVGTTTIAILIGIAFSAINYSVFGKWSVNMLFIPELADRKGMDFVCATVKT